MIRIDPSGAALATLRPMAEQALSRAAGAPLVSGNRVRLLRDATENYPAWLDAIESANHSITLESYIFADDPSLVIAVGLCLIAGAVVALLFPWVLVVPFAIAAAGLGVTLVVNGVKLRRTGRLRAAPERHTRGKSMRVDSSPRHERLSGRKAT